MTISCSRSRRILSRSALRLLGCLAIFVGVADAQDQVLWRETLPAPVAGFEYAPTGSLLISLGGGGLLALDPQTGTRLWSRSGGGQTAIVSSLVQYRQSAQGPFFVQNNVGWQALTVSRRLWLGHSETSATHDRPPFAVMQTATGLSVIDLESGRDRWELTTTGVSLRDMIWIWPVPGKNLWLVGGQPRKGPGVLTAVRYESGEILWKQVGWSTPETLWASGALDSDHTGILQLTNGDLLKLELSSGKLLWRSNRTDRGGKADNIRHVVVAGTRALITDEEARPFLPQWRRLIAVSAYDGKVLWNWSTAPSSGPFDRLVRTPGGLLAIGSTYMTLLDPATGAAKWTSKSNVSRTYLVEDDTLVFATRNNGVIAYDLASGAAVPMGTCPPFRDGEAALSLERLERGRLLVSAPQNLCMLGGTGQVLYSLHLTAPRGMSRLVWFAQSATAALASDSQAQVSNPRSTATIDGLRFVYFLTEDQQVKGFKSALVRIEKETGKETGRLRLAERTPDFRLEPSSGVVVLREGARTISAHRFQLPAGGSAR